jgi:hypothetical protein
MRFVPRRIDCRHGPARASSNCEPAARVGGLVVRQSVELIASPYYLFVSTRSVYADLARSTDEDAPLHGDVDSDDVSTHYGALKAMCERVVGERPGSTYDPDSLSDRMIRLAASPTGRIE